MTVLRDHWKELIARGLAAWAAAEGLGDALGDTAGLADRIQAEQPPRPEMGDLAFPLFPFAKALRKGPPQIAQALALLLAPSGSDSPARQALKAALSGSGKEKFLADWESGALGTPEAAGPYLNVRFDRGRAGSLVLGLVESAAGSWGRGTSLAGQKILVEFSSPNTNKPLHLGHLRNNALGEGVSRLLSACGAEVRKVNLFNDRGIHICKSMIAWQRWGEGKDPVAEGLKSDHFVAKLYVRYQEELKAQIKALKESDPSLAGKDDDDIWLSTEVGKAAQTMLQAWEAGDAEVRALWERMNSWAIGGIMETYRKTGVSFDWIQYEHDTYLLGKAEAVKGLESGAFRRREDGAVVCELPWKDSAEAEKNALKVILRSDGTSIYLTQDLGTAIRRHEEWPYDQAIYVVASEQDYHFKVLFHCLKALGHSWAEKLYHLSYGMVNLPTGRMKTREGTVVDADVLLDELAALAKAEIDQRGREDDVGDAAGTSYAIALGALHYFLLQVSPTRDMIFNPQESLSFTGNTGPYLQYMGARISSMVRKAPGPLAPLSEADGALLREDQAWELTKLVEAFPSCVAQSAADRDPSRLGAHLYDTAKAFSRFYHDLPVLTAGDPALVQARLALSRATLEVLRNGMGLLNIPFLEAM